MHNRLALGDESPHCERGAEVAQTFAEMERVTSWAHTNANNRRIVALAPAVAGALRDAGHLTLNPLHFLGAIDPAQLGEALPGPPIARASRTASGQELLLPDAGTRARRPGFSLSDSDEDGAE